MQFTSQPNSSTALIHDLEETKSKFIQIRCPFHEDRRPSMSVNSTTLAAKCFACHARHQFSEQERSLIMRGLPSENCTRRAGMSLSEIVQRLRRCDENLLTEIWWQRRNIPCEIIDELGIKSLRINKKNYVAFVYLSPEGRIRYIKLRCVDTSEKRIHRVPTGASTLLYNLPALDDLRSEEPPYIVEGEPDVAAFLHAGERGVVSVPDGNGTRLTQALLAPLRRFASIYIAVDSDPAGEDLANRLHAALHPIVCRRLNVRDGAGAISKLKQGGFQ